MARSGYLCRYYHIPTRYRKSSLGIPQIFVACGLLSVLKAALHQEIRLDGIRDSAGRTLLHWAVTFHQRNVTEFLLKSSAAELNVEDFGGNTPLHYAIRCAYYPVNAAEDSPMTRRGFMGNFWNNIDQSKNYYYLSRENETALSLLVENQCTNVNAKGSDQVYHLITAADGSSDQTFMTLMTRDDIDTHVRDSRNRTALDLAHRTDIVQKWPEEQQATE